MSICNVKKVREIRPHWQTAHKKKLYNHPMRWEPALDTNIVQIRANFARSSHKPQDSGQLTCSRICMKSRKIREPTTTVVSPVVNYNG